MAIHPRRAAPRVLRALPARLVGHARRGADEALVGEALVGNGGDEARLELVLFLRACAVPLPPAPGIHFSRSQQHA